MWDSHSDYQVIAGQDLGTEGASVSPYCTKGLKVIFCCNSSSIYCWFSSIQSQQIHMQI